MIIDTHCHLNSKDYDNVEKIISDIVKSDVEKVFVCGYNVETNKEAIELANKYPFVYASVGFHPSNIEEIKESDYLLLEEQLRLKKVIAVGEIGLDYHWQTDNKDKQKEVFKRQLSIAAMCHKPVIIHNRDAEDDMYNILKDTNTRGIMHCFNGTLETGMKYIELGFLLGIGGIITFEKNVLIREVIKKIPLEYMVLETDSPYLSPEPNRGKKNNPTYITYVASKVAELKNISYNTLCLETTGNVFRLFDL